MKGKASKKKVRNIVHFVRKYDGIMKYVCIRACATTKSKSTRDWSKVTCKNCLKQKKRS